jgi:hypothetical protein
MAPKRPSGAALAAELASAMPAPLTGPPPPLASSEPDRRRGRRPVAENGMPITLRLDAEVYGKLAGHLPALQTPGRPMPTVQDMIRAFIRATVADERLIYQLWQKGREP